MRGQTRCAARECLCPTMSPTLVSINYSHSHGRNGNFLARQRGMDYHTGALHLLNPVYDRFFETNPSATVENVVNTKTKKEDLAFPKQMGIHEKLLYASQRGKKRRGIVI